MKNRLLVAMLAFPILMLVLSGIDAWRQTTTATTWTLPIMGYDPRDLVRGQYVQFRYILPLTEADFNINAWRLCFTGDAGNTKASFFEAMGPDETPRCDAVGRQINGHDGFIFNAHDKQSPAFATGMLYIPEEHSQRLTKLLLDENLKHDVRVQVALNGKITPVDILINGTPYRDHLAP